MKRMNLRKSLRAAVLMSGALLGTSALAEPPHGAYGSGYGMGGMMPGYGPGYGMGAGTMGGYGGGAGYGMGPEMMGGYGADYGMTRRYDRESALDLNAEQRGKITKIRDDVRRKHWALMGEMQDEQSQMNDQYRSDARDDAALSAGYRRMSELRQQMYDLSLSAQRQIDTVLTKEQREKMRHG